MTTKAYENIIRDFLGNTAREIARLRGTQLAQSVQGQQSDIKHAVTRAKSAFDTVDSAHRVVKNIETTVNSARIIRDLFFEPLVSDRSLRIKPEDGPECMHVFDLTGYRRGLFSADPRQFYVIFRRRKNYDGDFGEMFNREELDEVTIARQIALLERQMSPLRDHQVALEEYRIALLLLQKTKMECGYQLETPSVEVWLSAPERRQRLEAFPERKILVMKQDPTGSGSKNIVVTGARISNP